MLGKLVFCEAADSTYGRQEFTGAIPEPTCVYAVDIQGVRGVKVLSPDPRAPGHLLVVSGLSSAALFAAIRRRRPAVPTSDLNRQDEC